MNMPIVTYWVNLNYRIKKVNDAFMELAGSEMPPPLDQITWEGADIMDLIEGEECRLFYQVMLQRVRITGKPYAYPYRCDSPGVARYMRMQLTPEAGNVIRHDNFTELERKLIPRIRFYQGDASNMKRCSICNRLKSGHTWVDLMEENIFYKDTITSWPVDYTVCTDCLKKLPGIRRT
jgi:hypothetical protein